MNMININKHAPGLVNAIGADGEPASSRALAEPFVVKQSDCDRQSTGLMGSFFHMNIILYLMNIILYLMNIILYLMNIILCSPASLTKLSS